MTGVQTCALPICPPVVRRQAKEEAAAPRIPGAMGFSRDLRHPVPAKHSDDKVVPAAKEMNAGGWRKLRETAGRYEKSPLRVRPIMYCVFSKPCVCAPGRSGGCRDAGASPGRHDALGREHKAPVGRVGRAPLRRQDGSTMLQHRLRRLSWHWRRNIGKTPGAPVNFLIHTELFL